MSNLTTLQRRFVEEYCGEANFNATEAAARAGYEGNRNTLSAIGSQNLGKVKIERAISERLDELAMSAGEATKRLADIARADIGDFLEVLERTDDDGNVHEVLAIDHQAVLERGGGVIQGFDKSGRPKMYDAQKALKTILDAHGAFNHKQKHEHAGNDGGPVRTVTANIDLSRFEDTDDPEQLMRLFEETFSG